MAYTIQDGLADIRHEIGNTLVGIDNLRVLNEAGQKLYNLRDWNFLVRVGETLGGVQGQSWIELPLDFGQIVTLQYTNGLTASVILSTLDQIDLYRSQLITIPSYTLYTAISWVPGTTTGSIVPRLEVFPSPPVTDTALLTMTYRVRWTLPPASTDSEPIPIPEWFEALYRQMIRAVAKGYQAGDMQARISDVRGGLDFLAAERQDGAQQREFGQVRNGSMSMGVAGDDVQWQLSRMPLPPEPGY